MDMMSYASVEAEEKRIQYPSHNVRVCIYLILGSGYWTNDMSSLPLQVNNLTL